MAWKQGPMPPDTWYWGGVVPRGITGGFYFADFLGDHVIVNPGTDFAERIEARDVEWYDNCLDLPPGAHAREVTR